MLIALPSSQRAPRQPARQIQTPVIGSHVPPLRQLQSRSHSSPYRPGGHCSVHLKTGA